MDRDNNYLFKAILGSIVLRNKVFQNVSDIHDCLTQNYKKNNRYNWYDLGCFPDLLIKYNYIERYKNIFDTLLLNNSIIDSDTVQKYARNFTSVYVCSLWVAAELGNIEVFKFFNEKHRSNWIVNDKAWKLSASNNDVLIDLAPTSSLEVLKYVNENRTGNWSQSLSTAAASGKLENVKYLIENRTECCSHKALNKAVFNDHVEVFDFLRKSEDRELSFEVLFDAAEKGRTNVVKYIIDHSHNPDWKEYQYITLTLDRAAATGSLELVKFLHERVDKIECTKTAMDNAACNGYLDIVKFLHENRTEGCSNNTINKTADAGHLDIVKFLHNNRTENWSDLRIKAQYGHLEVVKYLCENSIGVTFKNNTIPLVCENGHFEMFKYLYENHRDSLSFKDADISYFIKDITQIQWCLDNIAYQLRPSVYRVYTDALNNESSLNVIKWIHENTKLPFPEHYLDLACDRSFVDLELVKYLHEHGATATTRAMDKAAAHRGNLPVISFLHHNRTEGCTSRAMNNSINSKTLSYIKYFSQNYNIAKVEGELVRTLYNFLPRLEVIKQYNL